jgi:hypothetical protein
MPVGPEGPVVAGLEPMLAPDDAAEAVGVVPAEMDVLGWFAGADVAASVTVGGDDPAARCEAAGWRNFGG